MLNQKREKKCPHCKQKFRPYNSFQKHCLENDCIIKGNEAKRKKDKNKAVKEFRQKDKSYLTKLAQTVFNKYIRLRDKDKPCVSCGHTGGRQRHASHYRPVGRNSQHRFNEKNVHSACSICNEHLSGNLIPYRVALIKMFGEHDVEVLENDNIPKKYSIEELNEIISKYRIKSKEIQDEMQD